MKKKKKNMSTAVCKLETLAHSKLSKLISQQTFFFVNKHVKVSKISMKKPTDGISCVLLCISTLSIPPIRTLVP